MCEALALGTKLRRFVQLYGTSDYRSDRTSAVALGTLETELCRSVPLTVIPGAHAGQFALQMHQDYQKRITA
jgi:hypothetical protein